LEIRIIFPDEEAQAQKSNLCFFEKEFHFIKEIHKIYLKYSIIKLKEKPELEEKTKEQILNFLPTRIAYPKICLEPFSISYYRNDKFYKFIITKDIDKEVEIFISINKS
jgi:hypothetical protein